jgi:hypothetical protein
MKKILSILSLSVVAIALSACGTTSACKACCKDSCATCCEAKGKVCGTDCCKK